MALTKKPKKKSKEAAVSMRLYKETAEALRLLADAYELSQGDVVEQLVAREWKSFNAKKRR